MNDETKQEPIIAFDTIYSSNETQLLKLAIPYINSQARPFLAAIIKAKELSYCYSMIQNTNIFDMSIEITNVEQLLELAIPYCNEQQTKLIRQLQSIKNTMQMFKNIEPFLKNMEQTNNMQSDLFKMFTGNNNSKDQVSSLFSNNMTEKQRDLFEKYKAQFENMNEQ